MLEVWFLIICLILGYKIIEYTTKKVTEKRDKNKVVNCLNEAAADKASDRFLAISEIHKRTGLPENKIKHICSTHRDIVYREDNEDGIYKVIGVELRRES